MNWLKIITGLVGVVGVIGQSPSGWGPWLVALAFLLLAVEGFMKD